MTVRRGSVTVKIYRQKNARGYTTYTTVHYAADGRRERLTYANLEAATAHAKKVASGLNRCEGITLILQGVDRLIYTRATEALETLGIPLDVAATEYALASQLLRGGGSVMEAVRFFVKKNGGQITPRRVETAVDELIDTRKKDGSSDRHVKDLRSRLDRFARSFACEIASVAAADIQDFLLSLKLAPKSVNNFRCAISNLFSFARLKHYVAKDYKPLEEVPEVKEPEREVGIYTPAEVQLLIQHAPRNFLAYVVIAAFAGLRQSEIGRLEWQHVGADYIRVPGGERRTKSKRLVQIQPNLKKWLPVVRQPAGRVVPFANISNEVMDLCKKAGVQSRHNANVPGGGNIDYSFVKELNDY